MQTRNVWTQALGGMKKTDDRQMHRRNVKRGICKERQKDIQAAKDNNNTVDKKKETVQKM